MPEPVLVVEGLRKEFGSTVAVDDVSFSLPEGGSLAIVGDTGVVVVDTETGETADPVLVDRRTGKVMVEPAFRSVPGPAADRSVS